VDVFVGEFDEAGDYAYEELDLFYFEFVYGFVSFLVLLGYFFKIFC
jgi:hypothetical protein